MRNSLVCASLNMKREVHICTSASFPGMLQEIKFIRLVDMQDEINHNSTTTGRNGQCSCLVYPRFKLVKADSSRYLSILSEI